MVKIRLSRFGSAHNPHYRIVVADARRPRDGGYIENLGHYDPRKTSDTHIKIDAERAAHWIAQGAQPTATAKRLLKSQGVKF
ncbi:small subunit ribosomal protein S16 [Deinococcus metalli]|uniref:Small ribosomal subunit protein bS16 n=1 Tax=Deinococcus metalli TaxID=1141878 RepID=A0A7W8KHF4_9DEIO|nr:30S ribosomal protein S16 [Deinococcus metalli]MBB5378237.1 small subunit ribosomal protein S16 [Deinococcus metalli]GHF57062.1 30S ribosomal protein S16 [Deinococcus metalli]